MTLLVKHYPQALKLGSDHVKDDSEVVQSAIAAIASFGGNDYRFRGILSHASDRLCSDRSVVGAAVKVDPTNLRYASASLRADRELVLAAVKQDGDMWESETNRRPRQISHTKRVVCLCFPTRVLNKDKSIGFV